MAEDKEDCSNGLKMMFLKSLGGFFFSKRGTVES